MLFTRIFAFMSGRQSFERFSKDAGSTGAPVEVSEALERMREGNARFVAGRSLHDHQDARWRKQTLRDGQHPYATVIACSDSRVPPEVLFDQGLGDIFVIRIAGNICGIDEVASVEYGIDHLQTPLIVILGHEDCGAVTAAVESPEARGALRQLLAHILPAVEKARENHPRLEEADLIRETTRQNVWNAIETLFKSSAGVRRRAAKGLLRVEAAFYDLDSGRVEWMGRHPDEAIYLEAHEETVD